MSSMAIENRAVTVSDFSRVTENDNLSVEGRAFFSRGVSGIRSNISSFDFFD